MRGEGGGGGGVHRGVTLYDCMKMYTLSTKCETKMTGYF